MEMGQICVRKVKVTDYNDIFLLNQELGYFYPIEKVKERIANVIDSTEDIVFVAQQGSEVIGYIQGSSYEVLYYDPLVRIMGFVVKEKYRNIGVGSMLINELECWAKEKGYSGITLTSRFERLNAHRFYEKHGYVNIKNQKNFQKVFD